MKAGTLCDSGCRLPTEDLIIGKRLGNELLGYRKFRLYLLMTRIFRHSGEGIVARRNNHLARRPQSKDGVTMGNGVDVEQTDIPTGPASMLKKLGWSFQGRSRAKRVELQSRWRGSGFVLGLG